MGTGEEKGSRELILNGSIDATEEEEEGAGLESNTGTLFKLNKSMVTLGLGFPPGPCPCPLGGDDGPLRGDLAPVPSRLFRSRFVPSLGLGNNKGEDM